jgi:hypothetical protein
VETCEHMRTQPRPVCCVKSDFQSEHNDVWFKESIAFQLQTHTYYMATSNLI